MATETRRKGSEEALDIVDENRNDFPREIRAVGKKPPLKHGLLSYKLLVQPDMAS